MAEQVKLMSAKKAMKQLNKIIEAHQEDQTVQWYVGNKVAGTTVQYNQWADLMWTDKQLHLCILDAACGVKQYSKTYSHLTKYNPAWQGFYPSQYNVKVIIDEAGNQEDKAIKDTEQLQNVRNLKRGEKFYFAGVMYKVSKLTLGHASDDTWGWELLAEDQKATKEGIFIRKTQDAYIIFNFALQTNTTRQFYGSAPNVANALAKYIKAVMLDEDNPYAIVVEDCEL